MTKDIRRPMTKARKARIWNAYNGKCGECGCDVPLFGNGVIYDHDIQIWMVQLDEDLNVRPICIACNKPKTAADTTVRAKTKRQMRMMEPRQPSKRPIRSRGFSTTLRKKFNGQVEVR